MSKKKKKKDSRLTKQSTISQYIINDCIDGIRVDTAESDIERNLAMLRSNNMAITIRGSQSFDTDFCSFEYQLASAMMQENNKTLKKYRRKMFDYEFGGPENRNAKTDKRLIDMARKGLDFGTYFAQFDGKTYGMLKVSPDGEDGYYGAVFEFSIIGKKWQKYRDEYYKRLDELRAINRDKKNEYIINMSTNESQAAIFKPFDHVIFRDKERILEYIDNWKKNIPVYYEKYSMVSKLSILLYGEPGTGKSTFAKAVANYLGLNNVYVVGPDHFQNNMEHDSPFRGSARRYGRRNSVGNRGVYAIDDIDCVCNSRESDTSHNNSTAMSNLLQFLDNPPTFYYKADNGVHYPISIVIATTNYIDRLDDAVKRYGRFDLRIPMVNFDKEYAQKMCDIYDLDLKTICPDCDTDGWTVSPSYLQAQCLENVDKALKTVK